MIILRNRKILKKIIKISNKVKIKYYFLTKYEKEMKKNAYKKILKINNIL